jgi:hypothetical protein
MPKRSQWIFKKKLQEIEMKMPKFRSISISQIPTKPNGITNT